MQVNYCLHVIELTHCVFVDIHHEVACPYQNDIISYS